MTQHTPTVEELAALGPEYAVATDWVRGRRKNDPPVATRWRITDKGHAMLGEAMRRNALEAIAAGVGDWTQPPSRTDLMKGRDD